MSRWPLERFGRRRDPGLWRPRLDVDRPVPSLAIGLVLAVYVAGAAAVVLDARLAGTLLLAGAAGELLLVVLAGGIPRAFDRVGWLALAAVPVVVAMCVVRPAYVPALAVVAGYRLDAWIRRPRPAAPPRLPGSW